MSQKRKNEQTDNSSKDSLLKRNNYSNLESITPQSLLLNYFGTTSLQNQLTQNEFLKIIQRFPPEFENSVTLSKQQKLALYQSYQLRTDKRHKRLQENLNNSFTLNTIHETNKRVELNKKEEKKKKIDSEQKENIKSKQGPQFDTSPLSLLNLKLNFIESCLLKCIDNYEESNMQLDKQCLKLANQVTTNLKHMNSKGDLISINDLIKMGLK